MGRAKALTQLADLAPTLRERELRVLLAMTNAFASSGHQSGRLSATQLVKLTGLARSNVFLVIASLRDRSMIDEAEPGDIVIHKPGDVDEYSERAIFLAAFGPARPAQLDRDELTVTRTGWNADAERSKSPRGRSNSRAERSTQRTTQPEARTTSPITS